MSHYSNFGLDDKKRSKDSGSTGANYCPWCSSNTVSLGMSLCFANWVICHPCSKEGLKQFKNLSETKTSERIEIDKCFKKNNKDPEPCYMSLGEGFKVGISL